MFELFMYVYSYCNALSARFFAVYRALNSYFMIMIMSCKGVFINHISNSSWIGRVFILISIYCLRCYTAVLL